MTDDIERNLNVNYGAEQAENMPELYTSFQAAKTDVLTLLDEVYRLREINYHAGKRLQSLLQLHKGHLS